MTVRCKSQAQKGSETTIMRELAVLFWTFAKIGVCTFGGGYAMLPLLQRELVDNKKWITEEQLMDYFAIGQCTPGIIAVNTSTFVGCNRKGVLGGIFATLGMIAPSIIIICIITAFLTNFADIPAVGHALAGVRVCVCVLIIQAVLKFAKKAFVDKLCIIIFAIVLALSLFTGIPTALLVVAAAVFGALLSLKNKKVAAK